MPGEDELKQLVVEGIAACRGSFADPAVTELTTPVEAKKQKKAAGAEA